MATERDDPVSKRYRSLPREEPPAAIDAAVLAASRRAVGARPGALKRWGPPLSIAAMLVLATGVVIRMQAEKPGLETAMPPASKAEPPAAAAPSAAEVSPQAPPTTAPQARKRNALAKARKEAAEPSPTVPPPADPATAPPPPAKPATAPPPPEVKESRETGNREEKPTTERLMVAPSFQAAPPAARAGAAADAAAAKAIAPAEPPEAVLERIAVMRDSGRDEEADRALEAFRRAHPGYVIADAMWVRVRPRAP